MKPNPKSPKSLRNIFLNALILGIILTQMVGLGLADHPPAHLTLHSQESLQPVLP